MFEQIGGEFFRRLIGPVHVLDGEHERSLSCALEREPLQCLERPALHYLWWQGCHWATSLVANQQVEQIGGSSLKVHAEWSQAAVDLEGNRGITVTGVD